MKNNFYKYIYGLTVQGMFLPEMNGVQVSVDYQEEKREVFPVINQLLTENSPDYPFCYIPEGRKLPAARGLLTLVRTDDGQPELVLHLSTPVEEIITFHPGEVVGSNDDVRTLPIAALDSQQPPQPFEPTYPRTNREPGVPSAHPTYQDLFPYLYIRPWPRIKPFDRNTRFVDYKNNADADEGLKAFYNALCSAKLRGDRNGARTETVRFIEGDGNYKDLFIVSGMAFQTILRSFLYIYNQMHPSTAVNLQLLESSVASADIGDWEKIKREIMGKEYKNEKERAWLSVFALTITTGYDHTLLENLIKTLIIAQLVETRANDAFPMPFMLPQPQPEQQPQQQPEQQQVQQSEHQQEHQDLNNLFSWTGFENKESMVDQAVRNMANAVMVLPAEIYPLSPAGGVIQASPPRGISMPRPFLPSSPPASPLLNQWLIPYAVGRLQKVSYCLKGYEMGDICQIESVMRGESRELTRRSLQRSQSTEDSGDRTNTKNRNEAGNTTTDFLNEIKRTLDPKTTETSYIGDSGSNAIGGWAIHENPAGGDRSSISRFAKEVVERTAARIEKRVSRQRTLTTLTETEETRIRRLDNTSGKDNIQAVYRWLNKVYSLKLEDCGTGLIIQMEIDEPASQYIKNKQRFHPVQLKQPVTPESLGLTDFNSISAQAKSKEGTGNPLYYLELMETYEIPEDGDFTPPPEPKTVSLALQSPKSAVSAYADIPTGYSVQKATVTIAFQDTGSSSQVLVGGVIKTYPSSASASNTSSPPKSSPPQGPEVLEFDLNMETPTLPVCIIKNVPSSQQKAGGNQSQPIQTNNKNNTGVPPADGDKQDDPPGSGLAANVEILCVPSWELINQWKYKTYLKIIAGYKKSLADYYTQLENQKAGIASPNTTVNREIIRQAVMEKCLLLLRQHYVDLVVGNQTANNQEEYNRELNKPRYLQFFQRALQWDKMSYTLEPGSEDPGTAPAENTDEFDGFLKAKKARVMLPVEPGVTQGFLYFLTTGIIWPGPGRLTPTTDAESYLSIINDLKVLEQQGPKADDKKQEDESWEVTIPTSMKMLQEGMKFPESQTHMKKKL